MNILRTVGYKFNSNFKSLIQSTLKLFGYKLVKTGWNTINVEIHPKTIIDVGAAFGTPELYSRFPNAYLFLVDPVEEYEPFLEEILTQREGDFEIVALDREEREIELNVDMDSLSKSSPYDRTELTFQRDNRIEVRKVRSVTLDKLVEHHELESPFGLKIDTEGHELEVLKGATRTLEQTRFVLLEASIQKRFENSYTIEDLFNYLWEKGFHLRNVLSAPNDEDGLVRYLDLLFVRN